MQTVHVTQDQKTINQKMGKDLIDIFATEDTDG